MDPATGQWFEPQGLAAPSVHVTLLPGGSASRRLSTGHTLALDLAYQVFLEALGAGVPVTGSVIALAVTIQ